MSSSQAKHQWLLRKSVSHPVGFCVPVQRPTRRCVHRNASYSKHYFVVACQPCKRMVSCLALSLLFLSPPNVATAVDNLSTLTQGKRLFEENCAACHLNGGNIIFYARGKTLQSRALEKNGYNTKEAINQLTKQGKGAMPSYANKLSDQEVDILSEYILQQASSGWK